MSIYDHIEYRNALKERINSIKISDPKFTHTQLAIKIGVQKTFLSKVFALRAHFSDDQMYLLNSLIKWTEPELKYLNLLHDYGRTGLAKKRKELLEEIHKMQEAYRDSRYHLSMEFVAPEVGTNALTEYYLNPIHLLVHTYFNIESFRKKPVLIAEALNITNEQLDESIQTLIKAGILEITKDGAHLIKKHIHLESDSPLRDPYQALLRTKCGERLMALKSEEKLVFTVTFSADPETQQKIREEFLLLSKKLENMVKKAKDEKVYQLNFELFPWPQGPLAHRR